MKKILKTLIHRNILPNNPKKKKRRIPLSRLEFLKKH